MNKIKDLLGRKGATTRRALKRISFQSRSHPDEGGSEPRPEDKSNSKTKPQDDDHVVCTICIDPSKHNDRLCLSCQAWNDLTHLLHCKWDEYPRMDPGLFAAEVHQNWKIPSETVEKFYLNLALAVGEGDKNPLAMVPLEEFSGPERKNCILCQVIKESVDDHLNHHGLPQANAKVGSWRPFPVLYWKPRKGGPNSATGVNNGMRGDNDTALDAENTRRLVVPLVISTVAADGQLALRPKALELELQFDRLDCDLRAAARWNRETINAGYVKAWLEQCQADHGPECNSTQGSAKLPPSFRLIDTKDWCVVNPKNQADIKYVALSYVWAAAQGTRPADEKPFQLEKSKVEELEQPKSLLSAGEHLPSLLVDAIRLTADLGYQYLWVDRLCIVQDDASQRTDQINAMDTIYQSADLTIVALADHAEGLPGTASRPRRASLTNRTWDLNIKRRDVWATLPVIDRVVTNSRWNSRGWTYQERKLSRRHLFMAGDMIYLNCPNSLASYAADRACFGGGRGYEKGIHDFNDSPRSGFSNSFPVYATTVAEYTKRNLTHNSDKLNAFLGVASAFASQCETGMLVGLPERYFTQALAWHPAKRSFCIPWEQQGPSDLRIPSWSWAAWEGKVTYNPVFWYFQGQRYSMVPSRQREFGQLVRFKYSDPETKEVRPVKEDWHWFGADGGEDDQQAQIYGSWEQAKADDTSADAYELAKSTPRSLLFNTEVVKARLRRFTDDVTHKEAGPHGFNVATMQEVQLLLGAGRSGSRDLDASYDSADSDKGEKVEMIFDITDSEGTTLGQTIALWNAPTEGEEKMLDAQREYTVAVLGACRSNRKLARGSDDRLALAVLILEEEVDRKVYRRRATGAVNPDSWKLAKPEWKSVVLT